MFKIKILISLVCGTISQFSTIVFLYPLSPPQMQVGWVKADTKAIQAIHEHVITHNPRVSVSHSDTNTWNLHMKSVTEDDRGGYMCQLNTDPMKSQVCATAIP